MRICSGAFLTRFCLLFFFVYFSFVEIPVISVEAEDSSVKNSFFAPLGSSIETRYVHSLELTQVEDLYLPVDGFIWLWEERVKSHNAGLPTESMPNGFFVSNGAWMRFFGGRNRNSRYVFRIGNSVAGKNGIRFSWERKWLDLFEICPGKRFFLTAERYPLMSGWMGIRRH